MARLQRQRDIEANRIQTILDTGEALMIEARQTLAELDRMLAGPEAYSTSS